MIHRSRPIQVYSYRALNNTQFQSSFSDWITVSSMYHNCDRKLACGTRFWTHYSAWKLLHNSYKKVFLKLLTCNLKKKIIKTKLAGHHVSHTILIPHGFSSLQMYHSLNLWNPRSNIIRFTSTAWGEIKKLNPFSQFWVHSLSSTFINNSIFDVYFIPVCTKQNLIYQGSPFFSTRLEASQIL